MKREEILRQLCKLRYCVLWPQNWEDIGFTERPIWIDDKGYGYFSDDETCRFFEIKGMSRDFLRNIMTKLAKNILTPEDLIGTPLHKSAFVREDFVDEEVLTPFLNELEKSPFCYKESFFCGECSEGWEFFNTENELIHAFSKDYDYGELWENMSDEELSIWFIRLFEEKQSFELPINLSILRDKDASPNADHC